MQISTRSDASRSGITGIIRDITENKRAQTVVKIAEETYRKLFMNSQVGLFRTRISDGLLLEANDRTASAMGYACREELLKAQIHLAEMYVDEAVREEMLRILKRDGEVKNYEAELKRIDGSTFWCRYSSKPNWELGWMDGVVEDITLEKRTLCALQESEEKFRNIFQSSPMGMHMYRLDDDENLILVDANSAAEEILGADNSIIIGKTLEKAFPAMSSKNIPEHLIRAAATGKPWKSSEIFYDDEQILLAFDITAFQTSPSVVVVKFADAKDKLLAEAERKKLEEQLLQSQKMESIGRLAGGVAHDFNNMLTSIIGHSELIISDLNENDPLHTDMMEIYKSAERASELTRQLLAFSRKQVLEPAIVNLNMIINEMDRMIMRLIGEHIILDLHLDENLWCIQVDPGQIEQVIMNLAINARDAMPGGGSLVMETRNCPIRESLTGIHPEMTAGEYVTIKVSDSGVGMDKEVMARIFDPFFTTKEVGKGTGLGLSTVYGIVKQSGGYVYVDSESGRGTIFEIYFPRMEGDIEISRRRSAKRQLPGGDETVLVVEDDEAVRNMAVRTLKQLGYRVFEARSGGDALIICEKRRNPVDLIITDIVMPGMSGDEVLDSIRKNWPSVKAIYMSGYTPGYVYQEGKLDPNVPYIQKPFRPVNFARKIRDVLDS